MRNFFILLLIAFLGLIVSCSHSPNIKLSYTNGVCPTTNAVNSGQTGNQPFCLAVSIANNFNGQNIISSNNFPIKNLNLSVSGSGSSNVSYPISSGSNQTMDPNGCFNSNNTIGNGESCMFFMQITNDNIRPLDSLGVNLNLSFNENNQVFSVNGTDGKVFSSTGLINQKSFAYLVNNQGGYYKISHQGNDGFTIQPVNNPTQQTITGFAVDNTNYGMLYLISNKNTLNTWGNEIESSMASNSYTTLLQNGPNLYGTYNSTAGGVFWSGGFNYAAESLSTSVSYTVSSNTFNISDYSYASSTYLYALAGSQIYQLPFNQTVTASGTPLSTPTVKLFRMMGGINTANYGFYYTDGAGVLNLESGALNGSNTTFNAVVVTDASANSLTGVTKLVSATDGGALLAFGVIGDKATDKSIVFVRPNTPTTFTPMVFDNPPSAGYNVVTMNLNNTKHSLLLLTQENGKFILYEYDIHFDKDTQAIMQRRQVLNIPATTNILGMAVISSLFGQS